MVVTRARRSLTLLVSILALVFTLSAARGAPVDRQQLKYDPTSAYRKESIQGFTVLVNQQVLAHQQVAGAVRKELEKQLEEVARALPAGHLAELRKVKIWVEWQKREDGAAEFHPSAEWLEDHGYNPEKVNSIEISNSNHFVEWSVKQPWMVLHELAHAYHYLILGEEHPGIEAAYKQAVDQKLYDEVDHISGEKRKAWARNNKIEYFAELSEAYFGKNDYYPFTRAELEKHDPVGYALLQDLWGKTRTGDAAPLRDAARAARASRR